MMQPEALGGYELDPAELISIVERLSHADGSTGWIGSIGAGGPAFTAWLDPTVAATCWARTAIVPSRRCSLPPDSSALATGASTTCPVGGRSPAAAGTRLVLHGSLRVRRRRSPHDRVRPRLAARALPERPRPDHRQLGRARHAGDREQRHRSRVTCGCSTRCSSDPSSSRLATTVLSGASSFFTLAGIALVGVPLGIARRALDELTPLARTKVRAGTFTPLSDDGHVQIELARAEGRLRSARAMVFDVLDELWQTAHHGDAPTIEQRATFHLATNEALPRVGRRGRHVLQPRGVISCASPPDPALLP